MLERFPTSTLCDVAGPAVALDRRIRQLVPGLAMVGRALPVHATGDDNGPIARAVAVAEPGDVLVVDGGGRQAVALVGGIMARRALVRGVAGVVVDGSVRDLDELVELGLPMWTRYVRVRGPGKDVVGALDVPVLVGGATINPGDILVLDGDGVAVVDPARADEILEASQAREAKETAKRAKLEGGALSYEIDGLRAVVEGSAR